MAEPFNLGGVLLPGISESAVRAALTRAAGNEVDSGKIASPESSAALAVNAFGWFLERPEALPAFPALEGLDWPACRVDIERQMRFPWQGGRHPWLDAAVETKTQLIGVESKRFEPFRDTKHATFSDAYDRDVWGENMQAWTALRDSLRSGQMSFRHLDATQLVKHGFGLVTEGRRISKAPTLLYLFAEPVQRNGSPILVESHQRHRDEIMAFRTAVAGSAVRFAACSYPEWINSWSGPIREHGKRLTEQFSL
jgi:hypothetical protein